MNLIEIFNQLILNETFTLQFPTLQDYNSFHSQLRVIKHRKDKQYEALSGELLSEGKVIRMSKWTDESSNVKVWLGDRKKETSKINFNIMAGD